MCVRENAPLNTWRVYRRMPSVLIHDSELYSITETKSLTEPAARLGQQTPALFLSSTPFPRCLCYRHRQSCWALHMGAGGLVWSLYTCESSSSLSLLIHLPRPLFYEIGIIMLNDNHNIPVKGIRLNVSC